MIRNIMFDMVGVIMRFDTEGYLLKNHISDSDRAILEREVFHSLEWARGDRGTIQEEEAVSAICSRTPSRLHVAVRDLIYRENRDILPVEGMTDLLSTIKSAGYKIYLLSNTSVRQHAFWKDVPGNYFFDDFLISADVGLVKPQPEIFYLACERFRILPEETAYIDDTPMNAEAAYYVGMHSFVFHDDINELRSWLKSRGVRI